MRQEELKELWQKKRGYGNLVREMYAPKVDPRKQMELQRRLQQLHPQRPEVDESMKRPNGGHPPPRSSLPPPKSSPAPNKLASLSPRKQGGLGSSSAPGTAEGGKRAPPRPNYLTELHRRRAEKGATDVPVQERIARLQERARGIEQEVAAKEAALAKAENAGRRAANEEQVITDVSDMYVQMIRAKLQLLQELGRAE